MRVLFVFFILSCCGYLKAQTTDTTKKEKLVVRFYFSTDDTRGIYFFYPNDSLVIQPVELWSKESIKKTPYIILKLKLESGVWDQLYMQGWRLILYNPDDDSYFFERNIKT